MYDVVFFSDFEEGHLFPTFKVAHSLTESGLKICYVSIIDHQKYVEDQGFEFYSLFQDIYPRGFSKNNKLVDKRDLSLEGEHIRRIMNGGLDDYFERFQPRLLLISSFLLLEILILKKLYDCKIAVYTPHLSKSYNSTLLSEKCLKLLGQMKGRLPEEIMYFLMMKNNHVTSLVQLVQPLQNLKELILCPSELNVNSSVDSENIHFLGPCIRKPKNNHDKLQEYITWTNNSKLIYVSFGTQFHHYELKWKSLIRLLFETMNLPALSNFKMIISLGISINSLSNESKPHNVKLFDWIPQVEILDLVDLVITHGGLGTIKEVIMHAKPMIVLPLGRDQSENADRVEYHHLGIQGQYHELTTVKLAQMILSTSNDLKIKKKLVLMQKIFVDKELKNEEVSIVSNIIKN